MAGPKKGVGSGTKFELSTDGSKFTPFMSVTKVSPPEFSKDTADLTDNGSYENNNKFKESVGTFIDGGELKVEGWVHTEDQGLTLAEQAFFDDLPVTGKIISPKWLDKTITYPGVITNLQPIGDLDPENGVPYAMTMKVTGKPTTTKSSVGG